MGSALPCHSWLNKPFFHCFTAWIYVSWIHFSNRDQLAFRSDWHWMPNKSFGHKQYNRLNFLSDTTKIRFYLKINKHGANYVRTFLRSWAYAYFTTDPSDGLQYLSTTRLLDEVWKFHANNLDKTPQAELRIYAIRNPHPNRQRCLPHICQGAFQRHYKTYESVGQRRKVMNVLKENTSTACIKQSKPVSARTSIPKASTWDITTIRCCYYKVTLDI